MDRPGTEMTPRLTYLQQILPFTPPTLQNGASFLLISALSSSKREESYEEGLEVEWSVSFALMKHNRAVDNTLNPSVQWFMDQAGLQAGIPFHQKD